MPKPAEKLPIIDSEKIGNGLDFHGLSGPEIDQRLEQIEKKERLPAKILQWWRGDAHTHSAESTREGFDYPEGLYDAKEILKYYEVLGLEFTCFTEHSSLPGNPELQSQDSQISQSLIEHAKRVRSLREEYRDECRCVPFSGAEISIMYSEDGEPTIDTPEQVLQELDFVIASRHGLPEDKEKNPAEIKKSLMTAVANPYVNAIGHPDYKAKRGPEDPLANEDYEQEYWQMWSEVLQEMKDKNKAFEINLKSQPDHRLVKIAAEIGVKFLINYDAHEFNQFLNYGRPESISEEQRMADQDKYDWAQGVGDQESNDRLEKYKREKLASGPGVVPILRLARWIKYLEEIGVEPEQVVNSSRENFLAFISSQSVRAKSHS